jgi:CRISPR-associated protein Cmr1
MEINISRFKGIEEKIYELEVVTPLFLGGADPQKAELRTAPFKAAMRFWWRAIYGSDDIAEMKKRESEIFGDTEKKSNFSITVSPQSTVERLKNLTGGKTYPVTSSKFAGTRYLNILDYLAYGVCTYDRNTRGNVYTRAFIEPGTKFSITLKYPKNKKAEILKSFEAMVHFGGVGSKSRNGFGSLYCNNLENTMKIEDFKTSPLKSYTSFSSQSRLLKDFQEETTWQDSLSDVGLAYRTARLSVEPKHQFEKRALIAMPIIAQGETIPKNIKDGRHPKTYFLHVNKIGNKYKGQILFLPYNYENNDYQKVNATMILSIGGAR